MKDVAYNEAATEVLTILEHTEIEEVNKIPKNFIEFLKEKSSKTYKPDFDFSKPINELNLKQKTQSILAIIYLKYWANEEERIAFKKRIKENEKKYQQELKKQYSTDNLFKTKKNIIENFENQTQENSLPEVKKENFIQKIINKMKNIFRGKNI